MAAGASAGRAASISRGSRRIRARVAKRQMDNFGGMLSFELKGNVAAFMNALRSLRRGREPGGVESLAGHPATMSHSNIPPAQREAMGIPDHLVRLSVGIEHADDLLADLGTALAAPLKLVRHQRGSIAFRYRLPFRFPKP